MLRRRRTLAAGIVALIVLGNAYLDYLLLLRDPRQLQAILTRFVQAVAPEYRPQLGTTTFSFGDRRLVLMGVELYEKGSPGSDPVVRVEQVEATFQLVPPAVRRIRLVRPQATLRVDREGRLNLVGGGSDEEVTPPSLLDDLDVEIEDGHVRLQNDLEGLGSDLLLTEVQGRYHLTAGAEVELVGNGAARLGALFAGDDPRAGGGTVRPGTPPDRRFKDIFPRMEYRVVADRSGPVRVDVAALGASCTPELRSAIPLHFQRTIWSEVDPSGGTIDVHASIVGRADAAKVSVSVRPRQVWDPLESTCRHASLSIL